LAGHGFALVTERLESSPKALHILATRFFPAL
jgi:hypothetical protein